jgi:hypothetical protein
MQQRLREAREESLIRSVGRMNGRRRWWNRRGWAGAPRRGHGDLDFHDRGEDVWKALRF